MTTLAITPNWKNKSAKFKGTVAAGEHVSVTIQNDDGEGGEFIDDASTLRLRVVNPCNGRTLAIFPEPAPEGETPETWDSDLSPLRCTLNLNTVQMLKAVPPAANVPLLFVLDDYDNNTLYFKEQFPVEHWPRLRGEEEPTDLDNYKDIIADFNTRLDGYDTRITGAENAAQAATANASAAAAKANQAVGIANQAVSKAETAQNSAAASAEAAHNSALAAEEAQEAAESAVESINSPDATLTEEGVAADAKAAGDAIATEESRAKAAEAAEKSRAEGVESGLDTRLTAAEKAIDDEAILRAAADADLNANKADKTAVAAISSDVAAAQTAISNLSANKADKATTYTKTEVDTKIAGVQTFQKYLVNELPDPDEADMKGLYLVPTGETTEEGDLCEEWTVVEENGEKRWEKIGGTVVDLSGYVPTSRTVNGKALTDNVSLSGADIAVSGTDSTKIDAALAGKASTADATLTERGPNHDGFSAWIFTPSEFDGDTIKMKYGYGGWQPYTDSYGALGVRKGDAESTMLTWVEGVDFAIGFTATRTALPGYQLGSQDDKPLASEAEAEALRDGKLDKSDVVSPSTSATTGQAADAKATGDALAGKLSVGSDGTVSTNVKLTGMDIARLATINSGAAVGNFMRFRIGAATDEQFIAPAYDATAQKYGFWAKNGANDAGTFYALADFATLSNIAPAFSTSATYALNALCVHNGVLYRCITAITTAEAWTEAHWTEATVEDVLAALRTGKQDALSQTQLDNIAAVPDKLDKGSDGTLPLNGYDIGIKGMPGGSPGDWGVGGYGVWYGQPPNYTPSTDMNADDVQTGSGVIGWYKIVSASKLAAAISQLASKATPATAGNLAALDASGNPTDSQIPAANVALKGNIPYSLGTPTVIASASSETVEGETVNYGAATLANRTANIVQVTAATALDELRITFPAATSGKVRDFGLRVEIGTGSAALAAPALVPIAPTGETIKIENNAAEIPVLADGTATAKGVTLLYFSETAPGVFVVKGEQVEEVL